MWDAFENNLRSVAVIFALFLLCWQSPLRADEDDSNPYAPPAPVEAPSSENAYQRAWRRFLNTYDSRVESHHQGTRRSLTALAGFTGISTLYWLGELLMSNNLPEPEAASIRMAIAMAAAGVTLISLREVESTSSEVERQEAIRLANEELRRVGDLDLDNSLRVQARAIADRDVYYRHSCRRGLAAMNPFRSTRLTTRAIPLVLGAVGGGLIYETVMGPSKLQENLREQAGKYFLRPQGSNP